MDEMMTKAIEICEKVLPVVERLEDQDQIAYGRLLYSRMQQHQAYITVIGETSTGKSTLINGLLHDDILPTNARPTNGTVVHLVFSDILKPEYYVVNRDASLDQVDETIFASLAVKPDENTLRLLLSLKPQNEGYQGLQVFDTPGYNSMITKHEENLREFIPNSDLLVFVCGFRTGFNQIDQDLLEVVRDCIPEKDISIILAINRVPPGTSKDTGRIKEILKNAEDSLHQEVKIVLVEEANKKNNPGAKPDTNELWQEVLSKVNAPDVCMKVENNLRKLLREFMEGVLAKVDSEISFHSIMSNDVELFRRQLALLVESDTKSRNAVYSCSRRLKSLVPPSIENAADNIKEAIFFDIRSSNKWLGKDDTRAWIEGHALPYSTKKEARNIEDLFAVELDKLDKQLEEIANTTVKEIERNVEVKTNLEADIAESVVKNILQRSIAKQVVRSLNKLGGVGGVAAGTGNMVKMAVKRIGKLVNKKFPRPVYDKIGRLFNKKFMAKANWAIMIAIEVIDFSFDASRWKGKLIKEVGKAMDSWSIELRNDLKYEVIPSIEKENLDIVDQIYQEDIRRMVNILKQKQEDRDKDLAVLMDIKEDLNKYLDEYIQILPQGEINEYKTWIANSK